MNKIKLLPEETIRKISAGDFINRPFLILKELLENSIDADSTLIKIYFLNKGINLIKVNDNGYGMNKEDLLMSVKRYSTSKIFTFNDLQNINSYGFRGEALSNISILCKLYIFSKSIDSDLSWCVFNDKNNLLSFDIKPVAHNIGTTVLVKDIFFNIHVKRKELFFSIENEWLLMKKIINNFILSNYKVSYYIYNNNILYRKYLYLDDEKYSLINRIKSIYGNIFIKNLFWYFKLYGDYWYCYGFIFINSNKKIKIIFLNKRIISYTNFLFKIFDNFIIEYFKKYNVFSYIIYFFIDSKYLNININTDKTKIFFINNSYLYTMVYQNLYNFFNKKNNICVKKKYFYLNKNKIFLFKSKNINNINLNYFNNYNNYLKFFFVYFGKILGFFNKNYLITLKNNYLIFSNLFLIFYNLNILLFKNNLKSFIWYKKVYFLLNKNNFNNINLNIINILSNLGINILIKSNFFLITSIPLFLLDLDWNIFLKKLNFILYKYKDFVKLEKIIIYWLSYYYIYENLVNEYQAIILISNFCKLLEKNILNKKVFTFINISNFFYFFL